MTGAVSGRARRFLLCALLLLPLPRPLPALAARHPERTPAKRDAVAGGTHWRFTTAHGAVHVWRPGGFRAKTAGVVVYIHGYNLSVDQGWERFKLAEQFKASVQNALFVVPEAPASSEQKVHWESLAELLREVARQTKQPLPRGHVVAMGHSGAYRTLASWLDHRWLDHLILLDALYANEPQFEAWISTDERAEQRKLILIGSDTRARNEALLKRLPFAARAKKIPEAATDLTRKERRARCLYLASQYGHNEMIANGKVIPLLLRLTRLRKL